MRAGEGISFKLILVCKGIFENLIWISMLDYVSTQLRGELRHLPEEHRPACAARSRGRWGGRSTCRRASPPPSWWTWPAGRWTWWGRSHSGSLTLSPATLRGDGLLWLCLSCLPLAVITGLCVSLMDVFIASGLVQWIQIARIVNSKYPPPPLYLQGVCPKQYYITYTYCHCLRYLKERGHWPGTVARSSACFLWKASSHRAVSAGTECLPTINNPCNIIPTIYVFNSYNIIPKI